MLKAANVFLKKLRVSYVILIAVSLVQQVKEFNLVLFTLAFIFIGAFLDILVDTLYTVEKADKLIKGAKPKKAKEVR